MHFDEFKAAVAAAAKARGLTDYELYYVSSEDTSVDCFQGEINDFTSATEGGICFRCIVNGKMGYAATQVMSDTEAEELVARAADNAAVLETKEQVFLGEGGKTYAELNRPAAEVPTTEALIEKVLSVQKQLTGCDPMVLDNSSCRGISSRMEMGIFNSKGLDLHYENGFTGLLVIALVSNGQEVADSYRVEVGTLDTMDMDKLTRKAVDTAKRKLGGDVAPTGSYPVVFSPDAMSDLLGTFCRIFSAEVCQKGLSRLANQEGEMVASPCVTIVDDPFHPKSPMPIPFDAEGSPTRCKKVVENGRLNTLLYNLKTAAVAGKETTGNGSKAGYNAPVSVSPFTMYIASGDCTEEELLAKAGNGVYITNLDGLHAGASPVTGDFSLQSGGFMIENGKKTTPVKSFTVAGNFYDLLKNITAVANNEQDWPVLLGMHGCAAPSVLVEGLSIAGK